MQKNIKEAVVKFLDGCKPGKILDIPSGCGWLKRELKVPGWNYYNADLYANGDEENFQIVDLNKTLPYADRSMDYIVCLEGLEHIENYHHVLREFQRILVSGGKVIVSTPNPLNYKSRRRYMREGTFNGFPHLVKMPKDGDHLHISPINLSFLITFAKKYGLELDCIHDVKIKRKNFRYLFHCLGLKLYTAVKNFSKNSETKKFMKQMTTLNVLLNDGIVVSFRKL